MDPTRAEVRRRRRDELQAAHKPREGVLAWLDEAESSGIGVGIASSSPGDWVEGHLDRLGLSRRFACVVCAGDGVPAKPDPASYRMACRILGAEPAASVAVEDSPHGVRAASQAGLYTVAVPHGLTADLDLSEADLLVESLHQVTLADALRAAASRVVS